MEAEYYKKFWEELIAYFTLITKRTACKMKELEGGHGHVINN
jgi:hypothetical protein